MRSPVDAVGCWLLLLLCILGLCQPGNSASYQSVRVSLGQTARLPCTVDYVGTLDVEWYSPEEVPLSHNEQLNTQDKRIKIEHQYVKEWVLVISNVRKSDAGNYTCHIGSVQQKYVELMVGWPPEIKHTSGVGSYLINSAVTLTCNASGSPEPKITWYRVYGQNEQRVDLNAEGSKYVIKSVNLSTAGIYQCQATNGFLPIATDNLKVDVLFAPKVKLPYREVVQEHGKWLQLSCIVLSNPRPDAYWTKNNRRLMNSSSHLVQIEDIGGYHWAVRLTIEQLVDSDYGHYRCHARNDHGSDEDSMTLKHTVVHQCNKSQIIRVPRDMIAARGEDILLNCTVKNLPKGDRLIWWHRTPANETKKLFDSISLTTTTSGSSRSDNRVVDTDKYDIIGEFNLFIRETNFSDQGEYICQITGHENYSATLIVNDKKDTAAFCGDAKEGSSQFSTILIVLAVAIPLLVVMVVVAAVLVYYFHMRRYRSSNLEEMSTKI